MFKLFKAIDRGIETVSLGVLVVVLFSMLGLSFTAIIFRWLQMTCMWIDPVIRHLVLTTAFLGGILAAGNREHIGIDLISKYVKHSHFKIWVDRIVYLICVGTLCWMSVGAYTFVQSTFLYEGIVMLGIHSGYLVSIIPVGLLLTAYRFFYLFLASLCLEEQENGQERQQAEGGIN